MTATNSKKSTAGTKPAIKKAIKTAGTGGSPGLTGRSESALTRRWCLGSRTSGSHL